MDTGWIKLHRKILHSAAWSDPSTRLVWIDILLRVNWERRQLRTGEWLEPGELIIGQEKFAKDIGITRKVLRRALKELELCGNLGQKRARQGTHLTVYNWTTYQEPEPDEGQGRANEGPDKGQGRATEEELKKLRTKEEKKKKGVSEVQIPEPLKTPEFSSAWSDWQQHRKEIRKPLTPKAASLQLEKMAKWGSPLAVSAIEQSIMHGWIGIFESKENHVQPNAESGAEMIDRLGKALREGKRK